MKRPPLLFAAAIALIVVGSALAWIVQTNGGSVTVRDVRWTVEDGSTMSALLYIPDGATEQTPAPGILATHGYINSRETQTGFAIEFARRGFVVLAIDQTGHGYSDPPSAARGFGGPDGLAYLRSLPFVDVDNIGLEGHSMGGWASGRAAMADPDGYRAMVLEGSSTGTFGVQEGTPDWPRNLAVVFSRWDEFAPTMWGVASADDIEQTEKLQTLFGSDGPVREGEVYGSVANGTARVLHQPATNHPGDHLSRVAIGHAVAWFQQTLEGGTDLDPMEQTWYWKEFGTLLAAIGMILLLVATGILLLGTAPFRQLQRDPARSVASTGQGWWIAALLTAGLGPLTLFPFKSIPETIGWTPSAIFPQSITNAVISWTTLLGLITIGLFLAWHFGRRRHGEDPDAYGLTWEGRVRWGEIGRTFLLALLIVAAGYVALVLVDLVFTVDFRFWVFAIKPMSGLQLRMAVFYFLPFLFFFLVLNLGLFGQLRRERSSLGADLLRTMAILVGGWIVLYLLQYVPLLTRGTMLIPSEPLWTIISYQLLPLMLIAAVILTIFNRMTGRIYLGAFVTSLLVTWIVVASQATHYAFPT